MANAERIAEQIRGGASFIAYARQFSQASSAAVGGDLGWMRAEQLPESIAATIRSMNPGSLGGPVEVPGGIMRSEEHTSELQSLMRISYAVFCWKKKKS